MVPLAVQYLVRRSFPRLLVVISFPHCSKFSEHNIISPPEPVWKFGFCLSLPFTKFLAHSTLHFCWTSEWSEQGRMGHKYECLARRPQSGIPIALTSACPPTGASMTPPASRSNFSHSGGWGSCVWRVTSWLSTFSQSVDRGAWLCSLWLFTCVTHFCTVPGFVFL